MGDPGKEKIWDSIRKSRLSAVIQTRGGGRGGKGVV